MITKQRFYDFYYSLNDQQRTVFYEILNCNISELLKDEKPQTDYFGVNLFFSTICFNDVVMKPTYEVFENYRKFCCNKNIVPKNKISFSNDVKKFWPVMIVNKKVKGVKYRVFVPKAVLVYENQ